MLSEKKHKNTGARSDGLDLSHSSTIYWLKTWGKSLFSPEVTHLQMKTSKGLYLKFILTNESHARARVLILT